MLDGGADISIQGARAQLDRHHFSHLRPHVLKAVGQRAVDGAAAAVARTVLAQPDVMTDTG
jgi:hypothetical protein